MRHIKTFILRLYADTELREQICGDLRFLPGRKTFPFKNNLELLNLLHHLANQDAKDLLMSASQDENEPHLHD